MAQAKTFVDYETDPIQNRPDHPPKPNGVAIDDIYAAWGHPEKNGLWKREKKRGKWIAKQVMKGTDPKSYAKKRLKDAYKHGVIGHNIAKFDNDVSTTHMGLDVGAWDNTDDTMFELFFHDPHSRSLGLKSAAEKLLGWKPDERDEVKDWLVKHGIIRSNQKDWGAHICKAPGDIVGAYAIGDNVRAEGIHNKIMLKDKLFADAGMRRSYDRERRLAPILLENERRGLRVDVKRLRRDIAVYQRAQAKADAWLRKRLRASKDLNVESNDELADALTAAKLITAWNMTKPTKRFPQGQRSTSKKNMTVEMFRDCKRVRDPKDGEVKPISPVYSTIGYRNRLTTCLGTFMLPWLEMAEANDGLICTTWNQVRQAHGDDNLGGARTSRLSSYPNFLNVPKDWYDKNDGYTHPYQLDVPELPMMRAYILPDSLDEDFLHVDYSQQEYRVIAHFEDGGLCARYIANPFIDFHNEVGAMITEESGVELKRRILKIVNFLDAYGGGVGKLALMAGVSVQEAHNIKRAKRAALPDVRELEVEIKRMAMAGEPIRTLGGSLIYCEEPRLVKNKDTGAEEWRSWEYKMLNYLIQRSSAEMTKEAIIAYNEHPKRRGRFMVAVHDELNASVKRKHREHEAKVLVESMMKAMPCDVPMVTGDYDAKKRKHYPAEYGKNWSELKKMNFDANVPIPAAA